ncbi:MAG: hypothetical protein J6B50_02095 [Lachnospiraceae bacterium]|nr:hypothetical protein [Lachnospiraceae bacterium]
MSDNMEELQYDSSEEECKVGEFQFENLRDAQEALREQRNINALKEKIDFTKTKDMLELYQRLVEKKAFKTPVGYQFLGEFREYLADELKLDDSELPYVYIENRKGMSRAQQEQLEFLQTENQKLERSRHKSLILIGVLIFMIVSMFIITVLNPNVGYINTENKILNRYAGWEEELTQREARIRERERELEITNEE